MRNFITRYDGRDNQCFCLILMDNRIFDGYARYRKFAAFQHGKPSLTDRISLRKKVWIFGISSVQRNHTFSITKFLQLVVK
ncbi:MAG: hypothetical protein BHW11_07960 [Clostridium sp. CAG:62_40_43]|nr:MAG: hypothetical protein BHW11_07960 [Clostridium sp. CAG:62_40_43]